MAMVDSFGVQMGATIDEVLYLASEVTLAEVTRDVETTPLLACSTSTRKNKLSTARMASLVTDEPTRTFP